MQKHFQKDDLYLVLLMLHHMSMTCVEREFGYKGGNSSVKRFLEIHGVNPREHVVSRSKFMARKMRHEAERLIISQSFEVIETYTENGITIKRYKAGHAYGSQPQYPIRLT